MATTLTLNNVVSGKYALKVEDLPKARTLANAEGLGLKKFWNHILTTSVVDMVMNTDNNPREVINTLRAMGNAHGIGKESMDRVKQWLQDNILSHEVVGKGEKTKFLRRKDAEEFGFAFDTIPEFEKWAAENPWYTAEVVKPEKEKESAVQMAMKALTKIRKDHDMELDQAMSAMLKAYEIQCQLTGKVKADLTMLDAAPVPRATDSEQRATDDVRVNH